MLVWFDLLFLIMIISDIYSLNKILLILNLVLWSSWTDSCPLTVTLYVQRCSHTYFRQSKAINVMDKVVRAFADTACLINRPQMGPMLAPWTVLSVKFWTEVPRLHTEMNQQHSSMKNDIFLWHLSKVFHMC